MAKNNKAKTTEVVAKTKKKSAARVLSARDARPFLSDPKKEIVPLNELTEEQLILEGYRMPFVVVPNFKKTPEEREKLEKLKSRCTNLNNRHEGMPRPKNLGIKQRFTIHRKIKGGKAPANFKSTCSAVIYRSDISAFLQSIYTTAFKDIGKVVVTKMTFGKEVLKDVKNKEN